MSLKFPEFTVAKVPPLTEAERLEMIFSAHSEELKNEVDRGNVLCEIIYKLADGPQMLTPDEAERVNRICNNIKQRATSRDYQKAKAEGKLMNAAQFVRAGERSTCSVCGELDCTDDRTCL